MRLAVGRRVEVPDDVGVDAVVGRGSRARPATSNTTDCGRCVRFGQGHRCYCACRSEHRDSRARDTSTAPSDSRCGVVHCTSNSTTPSVRNSSTVGPQRDLRRVVTRWNIDSPANNPPMRTPYKPPTSSFPAHVSTLCAHPSSCNRQYASTNDSSIHPCGRRGSRARAHHRLERGVDPHVEAVQIARRSDRLRWNPSSGRMPRGSGDHHASTPSTRIGNSPWAYAPSNVAGSRSPPTATMSFPPDTGPSIAYPGGDGSHFALLT